MRPTALSTDFAKLPLEVQRSHIEVLQLLEKLRLSCRCEMNGRDFVIIVARGLSSPKYWLDMYAG